MSYYGIPWLDRFLGTPLEARALAVFEKRQEIERAAYELEDRFSMPYSQTGPADAGEKARREGERVAAQTRLAEMQAELVATSQALEDEYVAYRREQAYAPDWSGLSKGLDELDAYVVDQELTKALDAGDFDAALDLIKGAGHKYIRRIPTGDPKRKWIYVYNVTSKHHGKGPAVGEKIKVSHGDKRGHYEITHAHDDDHVTLRHDETGHEMKVHKDHVHEIFSQEHEDAIDAAHKRLARTVEAAMRHGTEAQQKKAKAALEDHREKYGYDKERVDVPKPKEKMLKLPSGREVSEKEFEAEQAKKRADVPEKRIATIRAELADFFAGKKSNAKPGDATSLGTTSRMRQFEGTQLIELQAAAESLAKDGLVKYEHGDLTLNAKGAEWANTGGDKEPAAEPGEKPAAEMTEAELNQKIDELGKEEMRLFAEAREARGTDKHKELYAQAVAKVQERKPYAEQLHALREKKPGAEKRPSEVEKERADAYAEFGGQDKFASKQLERAGDWFNAAQKKAHDAKEYAEAARVTRDAQAKIDALGRDIEGLRDSANAKIVSLMQSMSERLASQTAGYERMGREVAKPDKPKEYEPAARFYGADGKDHHWPKVPGWDHESEQVDALGDTHKSAYQMDDPPFKYINFDGSDLTLKDPKPGKWSYEVAGEKVSGEFASEKDIPGILETVGAEIRAKVTAHLDAARGKLGGEGWERLQSGGDLAVSSHLTDDHHVYVNTPDGAELGAGQKVSVTAELLDTGGYETEHMLREETTVSSAEEMQRFAEKFRGKARAHLQKKGHLGADAPPPAAPPPPAAKSPPPGAGGSEPGKAHADLGGHGEHLHPQEKRIQNAGKHVRRDRGDKLRLGGKAMLESGTGQPIVASHGGEQWVSNGHFLAKLDSLDAADKAHATANPRDLPEGAIGKLLKGANTSIAYHYSGIGSVPDEALGHAKGKGKPGDKSRPMLYRSADGRHSVLVDASYSPPTTLYGGADAGEGGLLLDAGGGADPSYAVMSIKSKTAYRDAMHKAATDGPPPAAKNVGELTMEGAHSHVVIDGVTHEVGSESTYYHVGEGRKSTGTWTLHAPDGSELRMRSAKGGGIEVAQATSDEWAKKDVRPKIATVAKPLSEVKPPPEKKVKAAKGEQEKAADFHKYMSSRLHNEKGHANLGRLTQWKDNVHRVDHGGRSYYTNGHMVLSDKHLKPNQKAKLDSFHEGKTRASRFHETSLGYSNLEQVGGGRSFPIEYHYAGPHPDDVARATLEGGGKVAAPRAVYRSPDGEHVAFVNGDYAPPRVLWGEGNEGAGQKRDTTLSPLTADATSPLDYLVMPIRGDHPDLKAAQEMANKLHSEGAAIQKSMLGLAALADYLGGSEPPDAETLDMMEKADMATIEQKELPFMKADGDGKPGESLGETSTDELEQTHADLQHRMKTGDDPALQARAKAIAGELAKRKGGEKMSKGLDGLQDYLIKAGELTPGRDPDGLPAHDEKKLGHAKSSQVDGGSADGGELDGVGKTSGSGDSAPAPGTGKDGMPTGTSTKKEKFSEDDAEVEKQMSDHKKALESRLTRKSLTPADIRGTVEHQHARRVSELRKGEPDVSVGGAVHPYSHAAMHGDTDAAAEALLKSEFYYGPPPTLAHPDSVLRKSVLCKSEACGQRFSAGLTACPHCGDETVQNRFLPNGGHMGATGRQAAVVLEKSNAPLLRPPPQEPDLYIPGKK